MFHPTTAVCEPEYTLVNPSSNPVTVVAVVCLTSILNPSINAGSATTTSQPNSVMSPAPKPAIASSEAENKY